MKKIERQRKKRPGAHTPTPVDTFCVSGFCPLQQYKASSVPRRPASFPSSGEATVYAMKYICV